MIAPRRGRWGTFLIEQRETRGWTQEEAFAALREGLGLGPKSRSSYVKLERGDRVPDTAQQEFLTGFYRAEPLEVDETPEPTGQAAVVAAIDRQTLVIGELVDELRRMREASAAPPETWLEIAAYAVAHGYPPPTAGPNAQLGNTADDDPPEPPTDAPDAGAIVTAR